MFCVVESRMGKMAASNIRFDFLLLNLTCSHLSGVSLINAVSIVDLLLTLALDAMMPAVSL